jgi:hypothetical protein
VWLDWRPLFFPQGAEEQRAAPLEERNNEHPVALGCSFMLLPHPDFSIEGLRSERLRGKYPTRAAQIEAQTRKGSTAKEAYLNGTPHEPRGP